MHAQRSGPIGRLTADEIRRMRQRERRCVQCGDRLPPYREVQDGGEHRCFACLYEVVHGVKPEEVAA